MSFQPLEDASPIDQKPQAPRLPYLPGLDGLRAVALVAVLLYHADLRWIPGGFLGVEVFFFISGYLIASLLLAEWRYAGQIRVLHFYLRRAQRLLPSLLVMIVFSMAFAMVCLPQELPRLRDEALSALGYVTNWYLVFSHRPYFEAIGRPSLFRHLWSLAVEEQFYLLWPLVLSLLMRTRRRYHALLLVLLGAGASAMLMGILYQPAADPSRVYYGTDTRATGLLLGAALGFVAAPDRQHGQGRTGIALFLDFLATAALGMLVWLFLRLGEFQPLLYRGGFVLVSLATAALVMAISYPRAHVGSLLGWRPLRSLGLRSYSIYLWHWPVFMVTRPQLDLPLNVWQVLVLRLVLTAILAELSYRYIEMPLRRGALERAWLGLRTASGSRRWRFVPQIAAASSLVLALLLMLGLSATVAQPPDIPPYLAETEDHQAVSAPAIDPAARASDHVPEVPSAGATPMAMRAGATERVAGGHGVTTTVASVTPAPARVVEMVSSPPSAPPSYPDPLRRSSPSPSDPAARPAAVTTRHLPTSTALPTALGTPLTTATAVAQLVSPSSALFREFSPAPSPSPTVVPAQLPTAMPVPRVTAIGDSVMLGAVKELEQTVDSIDVDAALGRRVTTIIEILQERQEAGRLGQVVVIHVGNNCILTTKQFDEIMEILTSTQRVIFVNLQIPHRWGEPNNTVMADGVKRYTKAMLVDWCTASADRPELFYKDGIHLKPAGARVYTELIAASVNAS